MGDPARPSHRPGGNLSPPGAAVEPDRPGQGSRSRLSRSISSGDSCWQPSGGDASTVRLVLTMSHVRTTAPLARLTTATSRRLSWADAGRACPRHRFSETRPRRYNPLGGGGCPPRWRPPRPTAALHTNQNETWVSITATSARKIPLRPAVWGHPACSTGASAHSVTAPPAATISSRCAGAGAGPTGRWIRLRSAGSVTGPTSIGAGIPSTVTGSANHVAPRRIEPGAGCPSTPETNGNRGV